MTDSPVPPGWLARRALLASLADLAAETADLREVLTRINDEVWGTRAQALVDIAAKIAAVHATSPGADFPDALTGLRDTTRALRVPRIDEDLDVPTDTRRALRELQGRMLTAVEDVFNAMRATGVEIHEIPENPIRKREREVRSLIRRLDEVDRRVAALEAARHEPQASAVQDGLVKGSVENIQIESGLARQALNIGDTTLDFAAFSRAVAAVGDLAADLVETAQAWKELVSARVRTLAEAVNTAAHRLTFRTRALARLVFGRVGDKALPAPSIITERDGPDYPDMVLIPAGRFMMGIPEDETARVGGDPEYDEWARPVHLVTIARLFWIGRAPVTRGQFAVFARDTGFKGTNWQKTRFPQDDTHPVVNVSAQDADAYVAWLSRKTGHAYRLPSEAECEYAARAGTPTARYWGDAWDPAMANAAGNHKGTTPVGSLPENPFGLHDMLGNVWEWCADDWQASYAGASPDGAPCRARGAARRVVRGGSWGNEARRMRSAYRLGFPPSRRDGNIGFRCARVQA